MNFTSLAALLARLLTTTLRNPANVECPHGQLCAWLTDRLRRNNTDGFALVDQDATCKVTAVTCRTYAIISFTGQRRPDQH